MDVLSTDPDALPHADMAGHGEQRARKAPKKAKSRAPKKSGNRAAGKPAHKTAQIGALMRRVRELRHRGAIFDLVAREVTGWFSTAMGLDVPQYLIGDEAGNTEIADYMVVARISNELAMQAEAAREALRKLLAKDLRTISAAELGDDGEQGSDENEELVEGHAVARGSNVAMQRQRAKPPGGGH